MKAWQIPISGQGRTYANWRAHWFEKSDSTNKIVKTGCGQWFNPGFAEDRMAVKCIRCLRAAK